MGTVVTGRAVIAGVDVSGEVRLFGEEETIIHILSGDIIHLITNIIFWRFFNIYNILSDFCE